MPTPTKGPRLGGSPTHERLMLNNLSAQLFQHKRITTTLTTTWTTRYRPTGHTNWHTIEGTITTTETSTPYDLVRIITYLTDDAEEAQGH